MDGRLAGMTALVAGAGSIAEGWSNGKASAVLMAREGARVFCVDRNAAAAEETAAEIHAEGGEAQAWQADMSIAAEVEAAVAACLDAWGQIDILFNNVGLQALGGPVELDEEDWDRLMTVNVKSMFLACKHVLPVMVEQGRGSIVNNSSLASLRFAYPAVAYSASKGAVNELTRNIAGQYAPQGIRCNAVLPGMMATPRITRRLKEVHGDDFESVLEERAGIVPMRRAGTAWDVAYAVLFLASDEAAYITGTELVVDGGLAASVRGRPWSEEMGG